MNTNQSQIAQAINVANKSQSSAALVIQTYCNNTLEQSQVDFSHDQSLEQYQTQINSSLATAQQHANYYLNTLQDSIISNISNIISYYNLHKAVSVTVPEGATEQQWIDAISALVQESTNYENVSSDLANNIKAFYDELTQDSQNYSSIVTNLNAAVDGDNGVLAQERSQISSLNEKIRGEEAGIALSAITVIGGIISIIIGSIGSVLTGGVTSTPLIISGGIAVAAGLGGEAASITELVIDMNEKGALLSTESHLKAEVKMANVISSAYDTLRNSVDSAVTASESMSNVWENLNSDLSNLIVDLNSGLMTADEVRTIFLTASNSEIQQVIEDTENIKTQLDGVNVVIAQPGQNLEDLVNEYA